MMQLIRQRFSFTFNQRILHFCPIVNLFRTVWRAHCVALANHGYCSIHWACTEQKMSRDRRFNPWSFRYDHLRWVKDEGAKQLQQQRYRLLSPSTSYDDMRLRPTRGIFEKTFRRCWFVILTLLSSLLSLSLLCAVKLPSSSSSSTGKSNSTDLPTRGMENTCNQQRADRPLIIVYWIPWRNFVHWANL